MPTPTAVLATIQLGDPVGHRGITIWPLFPRRSPAADYVTLDEALPLGFAVTEVDAVGSVPELLARNPLDENVLLYDGEELLGAKQNRILDVTVLVPARSELRIPVSCVEHGRWAARSERFEAAAHTACPELRRHKSEALAAGPLERGRAQAAVWTAVDDKLARHGTWSPTSAQADLYAARRSSLAELRAAFPLSDGQSGMLLGLGDALCLDWLSRPAAFARLHAKLLEGYLLDGLERLDREPTPPAAADAFLGSLAAAPRRTGPSVGLGQDVRLGGRGLTGSGLELDGELVQLCAFTADEEASGPGRIARPSVRR